MFGADELGGVRSRTRSIVGGTLDRKVGSRRHYTIGTISQRACGSSTEEDLPGLMVGFGHRNCNGMATYLSQENHIPLSLTMLF